MNTVKHTIEHVSAQLSDQKKHSPFMRWPIEAMYEYLNEGLKEIAAYRPEAFAIEQEITLVPGATQKLEKGVNLDAMRNTNGQPAYKANENLFKSYSAFATCAPKLKMVGGIPQYSVKSYAVDSDDSHVFYVSPPVPYGVTATVIGAMSGKAPAYTEANWNDEISINDKFYNRLIDYMMARAYQRDTESQISKAEAQRLLQLFYQAMGVQYKIDSARGSGYYQGEVGTGDPRSAVR